MANNNGDYALAGAGLLAGLISSAGQYWSTRKTIAQNEKWNNASIALANSAHQREVADLYAAGLNPILSASSSGAGVPSLSGADVGNPGEGLSSGINSAVSTKLKNRALAMQNAEVESKVGLNNATVANMAAQNLNLQQQNKEIQARVDNIAADTALKRQEFDLNPHRVQAARYPGFFGEAARSIHSFTDDITPNANSARSFIKRQFPVYDTVSEGAKKYLESNKSRAGDKTPVRGNKMRGSFLSR